MDHVPAGRNPLWVTGESYGGKYVPNVAYEIQLRNELNLKGVILGFLTQLGSANSSFMECMALWQCHETCQHVPKLRQRCLQWEDPESHRSGDVALTSPKKTVCKTTEGMRLETACVAYLGLLLKGLIWEASTVQDCSRYLRPGSILTGNHGEIWSVNTQEKDPRRRSKTQQRSP